MKRIISCALLLFFILPKTNAQQAMEKGQSSVNLYYGLNVLTAYYKGLADAANVTGEVEIKGVGPVGIVYEYMVAEKIGLGGEFGYALTSVKYRGNEDPGSAMIYDYKASVTTMRAQLRMNLHFAKSEKFDGYVLFNGGYRNYNVVWESNDPFFDNVNQSSFVPVGVKVGLGLRYFFVPNFGLHAEIALGSPLMCGGLSFKF